MSSYELIHTIIDEGIVLDGLHAPGSLEFHALDGLKHVHHTLHTKSLDAVTERAEDARGTQTLSEGSIAHYISKRDYSNVSPHYFRSTCEMLTCHG